VDLDKSMQAIKVRKRGIVDILIQGTIFSHSVFFLEFLHRNNFSEDGKFIKYLLGTVQKIDGSLIVWIKNKLILEEIIINANSNKGEMMDKLLGALIPANRME
jgi:hypothetical protein